MLNRLVARPAALFIALLALAGCTPLGAFNAISPKDSGVRTIAQNLAYGPDPRQRLDIYGPSDGANAGTVVFVYGGSWSSGRRQDYAFAGRAFAARGFTTVVLDYRLVPEHPYPDFVADTAKAVAWTKRNIADHGGDPDRLFLVGHSAGAYNAAMVALAPEFLRAEGFQPGIIRGVAGLSGPYDFLPLASDETRAAFGHRDDLPSTQPVNRVSSNGPAFLLVTGDADELVRPRNTAALATALRSAGRPVQTKVYPGVDHKGTLLALGVAMRGRTSVLDDTVSFFAGLGGTPRTMR